MDALIGGLGGLAHPFDDEMWVPGPTFICGFAEALRDLWVAVTEQPEMSDPMGSIPAPGPAEEERRMAKQGRRDVVPSKSGKGWDVTKPGAKQPVSRHQTQANAEKAAKRDIRPRGGEVAIHRRDGRIRDKDTMPPAKDPNPPKDTKH